ncbi:FimV family protein [Pseudomonas sp. ABC1]|uniref:FimV family protein n=1 Tax=Pseudomonas sp. ABC1 TaxID=2748080 RepID=UPI0015C3C38D|nr:FimV family protein [Pseudomonas sp. ABC1]QLF91867.1 FimV family protein [Pseudomonas sp. ABC1]
MARVRNLVLAIAAATALTSHTAFALELGKVELKSALNQPLTAEIELLDVQGLSATEVVSKLASIEDFRKAGVDRQAFLSELSFTPVLQADGRSVIRVSSSKPVREPYVSFLVDVQWPNGRVLREYTLLLDPPLYKPQAAAALAPQLPLASAPLTAKPASEPTAAKAPEPAPAPKASTQGQYRTVARDTLWEIAARNRRGGSVQQTMLAIQELNPGAFINGNINLLKTGAVLRLPSAEQVASLPQRQAIARVAEQNASWKQGRSGARQLDATARNKAGNAPARVATGDNLRLVASDAGKAGGAGESGDESLQGLRDRLATAQERLDSTQRENTELGERLDDLQGQLDKLQRLMQLKDDQLAALQAQLESSESAGAAGEGPFGKLLSNIWWLIGLGGSALLLLVLALLAWSRRSKPRDVIRLEPADVVDVTPSRPLDAAVEDPLKGAVMASDTLAQADIYIAYGRFNQAADLLRNALKDEPQRTDLRLKLMEVHAELEDRDGFAREEAALSADAAASADVERLKARYPSMQSFAGATAAATAAYAAVEAAADTEQDDFGIDSLDDAFDLSMDELEFDAEQPADTQAADEDEDEDDLSLDEPSADTGFDLDAESHDERAPTDVAPEADFSTDTLPTEPEEHAEPDLKAFDLNDSDAADLPEAFDLSLESDADEPVNELDPSSLSASLGEVDADLQELIADTAKPASDDLSEEFDFLADTDEITTKLDLARAYIDMGDADGARDILEEVIGEGNPTQQQEARDMLGGLS